MNKLFTLFAIAIIAAGGWYAYQNFGGTGSDPASYAYTCQNSMQFSLSPAEDFSWLAIFLGENANFPQQTLSYRDNVSGMRYMGAGVEITASDDSVILALMTGTTSCSRAEGSDAISWDTDTTDIGQNLALIVTESIIGSWRGTGDTKFTREFKPDGTYADTQAGKTTNGLWFAFTSKNAPEVSFPLEENHVYLQFADANGAVSYAKVTTMTLGDLQLTYMDRPGILTFTLVQ